MKSDLLLDVDLRLALLEAQPGPLSTWDRMWVRAVAVSWRVWQEAEEWPYWLCWDEVGVRARKLVVRVWNSSW